MNNKAGNADSSESYVYTITDWYDGARRGIADFEGKPHYYECLQDYDYDYKPTPYRLRPIDEKIFRLELEDWNIWLRYEAAWKAGEATHEMHPALPEDQVRHEKITQILLEKGSEFDTNALIAIGAFKYGVNTTVIWAVVPREDA